VEEDHCSCCGWTPNRVLPLNKITAVFGELVCSYCLEAMGYDAGKEWSEEEAAVVLSNMDMRRNLLAYIRQGRGFK